LCVSSVRHVFEGVHVAEFAREKSQLVGVAETSLSYHLSAECRDGLILKSEKTGRGVTLLGVHGVGSAVNVTHLPLLLAARWVAASEAECARMRTTTADGGRNREGEGQV